MTTRPLQHSRSFTVKSRSQSRNFTYRTLNSVSIPFGRLVFVSRGRIGQSLVVISLHFRIVGSRSLTLTRTLLSATTFFVIAPFVSLHPLIPFNRNGSNVIGEKVYRALQKDRWIPSIASLLYWTFFMRHLAPVRGI